ncbi:hypothetical protein GW17_00009743 [Ensete ventricosum]|nr:hypothetical protein GW17_00009743 [Ensete ventricosum]
MGLTTTGTTKNNTTAEKEQPDLAQNEIVSREEAVVEERGGENLVKPQSCTPNPAVVLPDESSEGEAKKTEGLVDFDKALQEFSDMEGIGVHNRQASSSLRPVGSSLQNLLNPVSSLYHRKLTLNRPV